MRPLRKNSKMGGNIGYRDRSQKSQNQKTPTSKKSVSPVSNNNASTNNKSKRVELDISTSNNQLQQEKGPQAAAALQNDFLVDCKSSPLINPLTDFCDSTETFRLRPRSFGAAEFTVYNYAKKDQAKRPST